MWQNEIQIKMKMNQSKIKYEYDKIRNKWLKIKSELKSMNKITSQHYKT